MTEIFFSQFGRLGILRSVPADSVSGKCPLQNYRLLTFSVSSNGWRAEAEGSLLDVFDTGTNLIQEEWLHHLLKTSPSNTMALEVRIST